MYIGMVDGLQDAECLKYMLRYGYIELERRFRDGDFPFEYGGGINDDTFAYAESIIRLNTIYVDLTKDILDKIDSFKKIESEENND